MELEQGHLWTEALTTTMPPAVSSSGIATNNLGVAITTWAGGATAGLVTLYVVLLNGFQLGALLRRHRALLDGRRVLEFVSAHGILKISLILVASAGGLGIARALLASGDRPRQEALGEAARERPLGAPRLPALVPAARRGRDLRLAGPGDLAGGEGRPRPRARGGVPRVRPEPGRPRALGRQGRRPMSPAPAPREAPSARITVSSRSGCSSTARWAGPGGTCVSVVLPLGVPVAVLNALMATVQAGMMSSVLDPGGTPEAATAAMGCVLPLMLLVDLAATASSTRRSPFRRWTRWPGARCPRRGASRLRLDPACSARCSSWGSSPACRTCAACCRCSTSAPCSR